MGRILDALAVAASCRPADMGPHDHRKHSDASQYCRVGRLANAVRAAIQSLRRRGIHFREWSDPLVWDVLPPGSGLTPEACATAASVAWTRSQSDWRTECCIFQRPVQDNLPEDWGDAAWDNLDHAADTRSKYLDADTPVLVGKSDIALYSDGGAAGTNVTFACQARAFNGASGSS